MPLAPDVDLDRIAVSTPGATGADLALIVNEAALFAARRDHATVEQRDLPTRSRRSSSAPSARW